MTLTGLWFPAQKWAQQFGEFFFFYVESTFSTPRRSSDRHFCLTRFAGELVYLNVFGQGLLFVNSYEAAVDLLEKRGAIYSDKPKMVMAGEL